MTWRSSPVSQENCTDSRDFVHKTGKIQKSITLKPTPEITTFNTRTSATEEHVILLPVIHWKERGRTISPRKWRTSPKREIRGCLVFCKLQASPYHLCMSHQIPRACALAYCTLSMHNECHSKGLSKSRPTILLDRCRDHTIIHIQRAA